VRPAARVRRARPRRPARRSGGVPRADASAGLGRAVRAPLDRPGRAAARAADRPRDRCLPLPAGVGAPLPARRGAGGRHGPGRAAPRALSSAVGRRGGGACWYGPRMTAGAVAEVLHVPGLSAYVEAVESALEEAVGWAGESAVAGAGGETLRSGGKRLRPMLVYLSAPIGGRGGEGLVAAGCAVELVHMATLVHDDQLDAAPLRRGHPTVWAAHGAAAARATGDYLFARAFAELCATGDMQAVTTLSEACLALARGEILQRAQAGDS